MTLVFQFKVFMKWKSNLLGAKWQPAIVILKGFFIQNVWTKEQAF